MNERTDTSTQRHSFLTSISIELKLDHLKVAPECFLSLSLSPSLLCMCIESAYLLRYIKAFVANQGVFVVYFYTYIY